MAKRKSNAESYFMCPSRTVLSQRYKKMKPTSKCIYIAFLTEWKRGEFQEKKFKFTYIQIREATGFNFKTIHNGITELAKNEFIYIEYGRILNSQKCNEYRMNTNWLELRDKTRDYSGDQEWQ